MFGIRFAAMLLVGVLVSHFTFGVAMNVACPIAAGVMAVRVHLLTRDSVTMMLGVMIALIVGARLLSGTFGFEPTHGDFYTPNPLASLLRSNWLNYSMTLIAALVSSIVLLVSPIDYGTSVRAKDADQGKADASSR